MAIFTKELVGWALVVIFLILILLFIANQFGAESSLKEALFSFLN